MSNKSDKDKLAKGAAEIREAAKEVVAQKPITLSGRIEHVAAEVNRLHDKIMTSVRVAVADAIKIGELLTRVRASRKGQWLKWLEDNVSFSHDSARNYIGIYERRNDPRLRTVRNMREAYALLYPPKQVKVRVVDPVVEELVSKGIAKDERDARRIIKQQDEDDDADEAPIVPAEPPVSQPAPKGWQPDVLNEGDLTKSEGKLVKHMRAYFNSVPTGRAKVFMRFVCERISGEL